MTERIALGFILGFLGGILCRSFLIFSWPIPAFVFFVACIIGVSYLRFKRAVYLIAPVFLIGAVLGMVRTHIVPSELPRELAQVVGSQIEVEGKVVEDPDVRETSQRITIETHGTRLLVVAPTYPSVSFGQVLNVNGRLEKPEPFATDGGRVFRYDKYLAKDEIFGVVREAHTTVRAEREPVDFILGALIDVKHSFNDALSRALPEPAASLASGMLLGGKQGLGDRLLDVFTVAGLVHIIVLSGYNIAVIASAVTSALAFLPRRTALLLSGGAIIAFVLASGAGSAALRAGIMATIVVIARATGRTYDALRALFAAVFLMLLYNPLLLAYDPGFQLSIMATAGLILGAPILEEFFANVRPAFLREVLCTTIAAQVFVLPLLLYQTGNLSFVALPANLFVLPVVPLGMALAFFAAITGWVLPVAAPFVGLPAFVVLEYVIRVAEFFSSLPLAQVVLPAFSFALVLLMYGGLAVLVQRFRKNGHEAAPLQ